MSDFSSAIMIHTNHKEVAKKYMEDATYLIKLNSTWLCRLSENDFCEMAEENYSEAVLDMSAHIPLMHVIHAEDHGFGICILHNKKIVFHFDIAYGIESEFAFNIGLELYGDEYMSVIFEQEVQDKVQDELQRCHHKIEEKIKSSFLDISEDNVAQFGLFGFDNDTCIKIKNILTITNYKKDRMGHQMIAALFSALELSRFSFISHEYVDSNGETLI